MQTADGERRAVHLAAQAAAGALGSLSGPLCQDFILSAEPKPLGEALGDGGLVQVEVTLLVLRSPEGQAAEGAAGVARRPLLKQPQFGVGPSVPQPPRQPPAAPQRLPASSWNMLSAMAGGAVAASSKAAAPGGQQAEAEDAKQQQQQSTRSMPNFFGGGRSQQQGTAEAAAPQPAAAPAAKGSMPAPPEKQQQQQQRVPVQRAERQPEPAAQSAAQPAAPAAPAGGAEGRRVTVGDYLVNSLTAQSLDLPPAVSGRGWRALV